MELRNMSPGGHINPTTFPKFIYDEACPDFVVREFIAAAFGCDGAAPCINKNAWGSLRLMGSKHVAEYENVCTVLKNRFGILGRVFTQNYEDDKHHAILILDRHDDILKFCETIGFRYCYRKMYRAMAVVSSLSHQRKIIEQNSWIVDRVKEILSENMPEVVGSYKNTLAQAVNEWRGKGGFWCGEELVTEGQLYIHRKKDYTQTPFDFKKYLKETGLYEFCKGGAHYSVGINSEYLPVYTTRVVGVREAGVRQVYDLNMDERYSNFIAEGAVSHNCNKLPELRNPDKATWNRIKVIPFETTFVRPGEPCPESYEEQLREKRFPMDQHFSAKIPSLLCAFAWVLLEHRKKPRSNFEPEKVRQATTYYQQQNDIYRQFVHERVADDPVKRLTTSDLLVAYRSWYKEGFPGRNVPDKNVVIDYFSNIWGPPERSAWRGYKIQMLDEGESDDDDDDHDQRLLSTGDGEVATSNHVD